MRTKSKNLNESEKILSILNILDDREVNLEKKEHLSNIIQKLEKRLGKEDVNKERTNES